MHSRRRNRSISRRARAQNEARDLELINDAVHDLTAEVDDVLQYQSLEVAAWAESQDS